MTLLASFSGQIFEGDILLHKLFVRDFDPQTNVADLENLFSGVGTVKAAVIMDRQTNSSSRKVAYIEMSTLEEARDCIVRFHGMKSDGYVLTVTEDRVHVPDPSYSYKRSSRASKEKR